MTPCILTVTDILKDLADSIFRVGHPEEQAPPQRGWLSIKRHHIKKAWT